MRGKLVLTVEVVQQPVQCCGAHLLHKLLWHAGGMQQRLPTMFPAKSAGQL